MNVFADDAVLYASLSTLALACLYIKSNQLSLTARCHIQFIICFWLQILRFPSCSKNIKAWNEIKHWNLYQEEIHTDTQANAALQDLNV